MSTDDCPICAELAGRIAAPGGPVYRNQWWEVAHHTGAYTDPGELIVKVRRHVESMSGLSAEEAATIGPILRAAVTAIEHVVRPERVYAASYNERVRHVHFFLLPRTSSLPAGHILSDVYRRARSQLRHWKLTPNPSSADRAAAAERIRSDDAWKSLST